MTTVRDWTSCRRAWLLAPVFALALAGCATGNATPTSWPGVSAAGDRVYVAFGPAVYAVDLDGKELWRYPSEPVRDQTFFAAPAVAEDGTVYAGAYNGHLFALDPEDGDVIWEFPTADGDGGTADGKIVGSPTIAGDELLVPTDGGTLFFLDRQTGETLRTFDAVGQLWSAPRVDGDTVYLASLAHTIYAVSLASAEPLWTANLGYAIAASPTLEEGTVLAGILGDALVALDAGDGSEVWRAASQGWLWGSPAVADGQAYFGDAIPATLTKKRVGNVYALDLATQRIIWTKTTEATTTSPLIVGEHVIVAFEDGSLVSYDIVNGGAAWDEATSGPIYSNPVLAGVNVVVGVTSKTALLQAFDAATGDPSWSYLPASGG